MKHLLVLLGCLIFAAALWTTAGALEPPGITYYVGGISAANVPTIDGDVSDWAFMPRQYYWTTDDFRASDQTPNGQPGISASYFSLPVTRDDFDILGMYIGWSPSTNMMYYAADITDSDLYFPNEDIGGTWQEDHFQFLMDANADGGNFRDPPPASARAQQWYCTPDPRNADAPVGFFGQTAGQEWSWKNPYAFWSIKTSATGWSAEVAVATWDWLDPEGPGKSQRHALTAGEIIGSNMHLRDRDSDAQDTGTTMNFADAWTDASLFAAFYLVSPEDTGSVTAVESSTWGHIKSMLR